MGLFKSLGSWVQTKLASANSILSAVRRNRTEGKVEFKDLDRTTQLRVIQNSELVYACVQLTANAFQQADLMVQQWNPASETWDDKPEHFLLQPFQQNKWLTESDFERYLSMHLDLTGAAYLWVWRDSAGGIGEIWPLPPDWVKAVVDNDGDTMNPESEDEATRVIKNWEVKDPNSDSDPIPVEVGDMIYIRFPDPSSLWKPLSPVNVARRPIELQTSAYEYRKEATSALRLPGVVVSSETELTKPQKDDIRSAIEQKIGESARGSALLLSGKGTKLSVLNPLEGFQWESFSNLDETRICMVFQVPPVCIGSLVGLENSPWSNTGEAKRWFYKNTVTGLWRMVEEALTRALIPDSEQSVLRFVFKTDHIEELQEDVDARAERATKLYGGNIIMRSEARDLLGLDSTETDKVYLQKINDMTVPFDAAAVGGLVPPASNDNAAKFDQWIDTEEIEDVPSTSGAGADRDSGGPVDSSGGGDL